MALTKKYLKTRPVCKVTFKIEPEKGKNYKTASLLGDFNNWDANSNPMKKLKNGGFSITLDLDVNREYKFRYLFDGVTWDNEPQADKSVPTPFGDSEDSVVIC